MSTASRVIKNTGFLYAKMAITIIVSLYSTRLILSALGTSDFGIFTIVGGAIGMLGFLNSAMANATQRFMSYAEGEGQEEKKEKIFNVSIMLHIAIAIFTAVVFMAAFPLLFDGILKIEQDRMLAAKMVYFSLVISTLFTIVNVPYDAVMNAHENMLYYSIIGVIESLFKLGVAYLCVITHGDKLVLYGVLMACIPLFTLTVMKVYCHKHYSECRYSFRKHFDLSLIKEIVAFSGWNFLTAISNLLSSQGIGVVLNHFFGTKLNASHGIALQVNSQLCAFAENMRKAINPVIVKNAGAKNEDAMNYVALIGCKYSVLLTAFFAIPLILEMPYVLRIWLKVVPEWAVLFCRLQLLQSIIVQLAGSMATSIYATGNIKYYAIWKSMMNVLPIVVTFICFKMGGGPFLFYASMIVVWGIGGDMVILYYAKVMCGQSVEGWVKTVLLRVLCVLLPMFIIGLGCTAIISPSLVRLLFTCVVTSFAMALSLFLIGMEQSERYVMIHFIEKLKFFRLCLK